MGAFFDEQILQNEGYLFRAQWLAVTSVRRIGIQCNFNLGNLEGYKRSE
jgi:hypothetical protein